MPDSFSHRSLESIVETIDVLTSVAAGDPASWGFDADEIARLVAIRGDAEASIAQQRAAMQSVRSTTASKAKQKALAVALLGELADRANRNSAMTDDKILRLGLTPRRKVASRPGLPEMVTGLRAEMRDESSAKISWKRGSNGRHAIFQVLASVDGGATWTMLGATPRTGLDVGFPPGGSVLVSVSTVNAGIVSPPCPSIALASPGSALAGPVALRPVSVRAASAPQ